MGRERAIVNKISVSIIHNTKPSDWQYRRSVRALAFIEQNCYQCPFFQQEPKVDLSQDWNELIPPGWDNSTAIGCAYTIPVTVVNGFCYPINVIPPRKKYQSVAHALHMREAALEIANAPPSKWPAIESKYKQLKESG